jgi:hypothetical protein
MRVYPGGPVEPPCTVTIGDVVVSIRPMRGIEILAAIAAGPVETIRRLATPDSIKALAAARHRFDPIGDDMLFAAGVFLAARLAGTGTGAAGWRKAARLAYYAVNDPLTGTGSITACGVDPATAPAWVICGALWHSLVNSPIPPEDRSKLLAGMVEPFDGEPRWLAPPAAVREQRRRRRRPSAAQIAKSAENFSAAISTFT